jgi:hypothetical protein
VAKEKWDRWTAAKWIVTAGSTEPYGQGQIISSEPSAEKAIEKAQEWAQRNPGREVGVYERSNRFIAEIAPVEEIHE